jgi:hypothetical protein
MKTINHIHIPRCSGIYIKTHIINDLKSKNISFFATNHSQIFPDTFNQKYFISGHFGLTPLKYRNDLINICLVRDPVDRFLSNFIYMHSSFKGEHLYSKLEEWIENKKQHNIQAKSLNKNINEYLYNSLEHGTKRAELGWCLEEGEININEIKNFIDSINLIDSYDNHNSFILKLNNLVYETYGFYSFSNKNPINDNFSKIEISDTLKEKIRELNSFDMEVYDYVKSTR